MEDQLVIVPPLYFLQAYHQYLIRDIYKKMKEVDFKRDHQKDKQYYFVPLVMDEKSQNYRIDFDVMSLVYNIKKQGYKSAVPANILEEIKDVPDREEFMRRNVWVKEDKPHACYDYYMLLDNL